MPCGERNQWERAAVGNKVEVSVFEGQSELWNGISRTPLEIGRQQEGDSSPIDLQDLVSSQRLVIAPVSARSIPRQALRIDSTSSDRAVSAPS